MDKNVAEQIAKKTTPQDLDKLMKEGSHTITDQIARDIDLKKAPK